MLSLRKSLLKSKTSRLNFKCQKSLEIILFLLFCFEFLNVCLNRICKEHIYTHTSSRTLLRRANNLPYQNMTKIKKNGLQRRKVQKGDEAHITGFMTACSWKRGQPLWSTKLHCQHTEQITTSSRIVDSRGQPLQSHQVALTANGMGKNIMCCRLKMLK